MNTLNTTAGLLKWVIITAVVITTVISSPRCVSVLHPHEGHRACHATLLGDTELHLSLELTASKHCQQPWCIRSMWNRCKHQGADHDWNHIEMLPGLTSSGTYVENWTIDIFCNEKMMWRPHWVFSGCVGFLPAGTWSPFTLRGVRTTRGIMTAFFLCLPDCTNRN